MKVRIELEVPEEEHKLLCMMAATRLHAALCEINQKLRSVEKYDADAIQAIRDCRELAFDALAGLE